MKTTIRAGSDDTIEVDGDCLSAEFDAVAEGECYVGFSDGTLVHAHRRSNGYWEILVHRRGTCEVTTERYTDAPYFETDVVTLHGQVRWVVLGETNHTMRVRRR